MAENDLGQWTFTGNCSEGDFYIMEIDNATERSADVKRFVALVRRYTVIEELTYENVHEFIDRILIHELDKETNTRKIEIFYSFVGRVDTGDKPTESISYFRQIGADVKSYAI